MTLQTQGVRTQIDRLTGLYVSGSSGSLNAFAGRNLTLNAAEVLNTGCGTTLLAASHDLTLCTVTTRDQIDIGGNDSNHARIASSNEIGSHLQTGGELSLIAGRDLQAKGNLTLAAENDIVLAAGRNEQSIDITNDGSGKKGGGLFHKTITRNLQLQSDTSTARESTLSGQNVSLFTTESYVVRNEQQQVSTKENFGPGKQSLKTTRDEITVTPVVSQLSAREISLQSGRDLTLIAPRITADTLTASAGNQLTIAAATATHELKETSEFKTNRFNVSEVTNPRVTGARIKDKIKFGQSEGERQAIVAEINARDITLNSGSDATLVAPQIKAETLSIEAGSINGETINPQARIQFLGIKESSTGSSSKNSHSFVHETVRDGGTSQETLLLPDIELSGKGTSSPLALAAPGSIVVGATSLTPTQRELQAADSTSGKAAKPPAGKIYDLQSQAQALAQQPGLAWLGELSQRKDVDWQQIELASQSWDYKRAGLTKEGAAVVVIVVAIVTWGAASGIGAAAAEGAGMTTAAGTAGASTTLVAGSTTTALTTGGAMVAAGVAAGVTTLAGQAAVSLINNQGDVGKTLQDLGSQENVKALVTSMLTAGLTQGVTQALQGANILSPVTDPGFANRFATYATKAAVSAGVQSLVYGTPLSETAKTALINSLAQSLTSSIGDWGKSDSALVAKTIAHAVVQCAPPAYKARIAAPPRWVLQSPKRSRRCSTSSMTEPGKRASSKPSAPRLPAWAPCWLPA